MARIDTRTGRLFSPANADLDLAQAVEDALFTIRGTRRHRPNYGSFLVDFGRGVQEIIPSVYDALRQVAGVRKIDIVTSGEVLRIIINDALVLDASNEIVGGALTFGGERLLWGGEEIDYGR